MKAPEQYLIDLARAHADAVQARADFRKALDPVPYKPVREAETIEEMDRRILAFRTHAAEAYRARCDANRRLGTQRRACVMAGRRLLKDIEKPTGNVI